MQEVVKHLEVPVRALQVAVKHLEVPVRASQEVIKAEEEAP